MAEVEKKYIEFDESLILADSDGDKKSLQLSSSDKLYTKELVEEQEYLYEQEEDGTYKLQSTPVMHKVKVNKEKLDEEGNPVLDEEGNPVLEEVEQEEQVLDEDGNPVFEYSRIPVLDENGNHKTGPKYKRYADGKYILDSDGNPQISYTNKEASNAERFKHYFNKQFIGSIGTLPLAVAEELVLTTVGHTAREITYNLASAAFNKLSNWLKASDYITCDAVFTDLYDPLSELPNPVSIPGSNEIGRVSLKNVSLNILKYKPKYVKNVDPNPINIDDVESCARDSVVYHIDDNADDSLPYKSYGMLVLSLDFASTESIKEWDMYINRINNTKENIYNYMHLRLNIRTRGFGILSINPLDMLKGSTFDFIVRLIPQGTNSLSYDKRSQFIRRKMQFDVVDIKSSNVKFIADDILVEGYLPTNSIEFETNVAKAKFDNSLSVTFKIEDAKFKPNTSIPLSSSVLSLGHDPVGKSDSALIANKIDELNNNKLRKGKDPKQLELVLNKQPDFQTNLLDFLLSNPNIKLANINIIQNQTNVKKFKNSLTSKGDKEFTSNSITFQLDFKYKTSESKMINMGCVWEDI